MGGITYDDLFRNNDRWATAIYGNCPNAAQHEKGIRRCRSLTDSDCSPAPEHFSRRYVWAIYVDAELDCAGNGELGAGGDGIAIVHRGDLEGLVNPETYSLCGSEPRSEFGWIGGLAHMLGLTLGLPHPPGCEEGLPSCDYDALMWTGFYWDYPETYLTEEDKVILGASPFLIHRLKTASMPTSPTSTPAPPVKPAVRVIYAIPSDRQAQVHYSAAVHDAIHHAQRWYAEQLGGYTFKIEGPTPQVCSLERPSAYYEGKHGWDRVVFGLRDCSPAPEHFSRRYVWAIYVDAELDCAGNGELGAGGDGIAIVHRGDLEGLVNPETYSLCGSEPRSEFGWIGGLAHELGHALGLPHPPGCEEGLPSCDYDALMWTGFYWDYPETYLTEEDKVILGASPFLNHLLKMPEGR